MRGRWAPSPTGELHLGNLRTALVAWLFARSARSEFLYRSEDVEQVAESDRFAQAQQRDLRLLGLDWDGEVVVQSDRVDRHRAVIADLTAAGATYRCWCSRREIRDAISAPHDHLPDGAYPGTCRDLPEDVVGARLTSGDPFALRLRAHGVTLSFVDGLAGPHEGRLDDFVIQRKDGLPAYNLAVVLDDADMGVEQVVRGADLVATTPRQIHLARLLGLVVPSYAHIPLVVGRDGERLAKRHGSVTLTDLAADGVTPSEVLSMLAGSLSLASPGERVTPAVLVDRFDPARLPRTEWVVE